MSFLVQGHASGQVSKVQVLSELEFTSSQKERALQTNPWDTTAQKHVEVLQQVRICYLIVDCTSCSTRTQLRKLVEAGVSQDELRQILSQLRSLTRPSQTPQTSTNVVPSSSYPPSTSTYQYTQQPAHARQFPSTYSNVPTPQPSTYNYPSEPLKVEPTNLSALLSSVQASSSLPTTSAMPPNSISSLYSALLKAGVVSADSTPVGTGSKNDEERTPPPSNVPSRDNARAYRKAVLSEKIKLTTTDIIRYIVHSIDFTFLLKHLIQKASHCCVVPVRSASVSV